MTTETSIFDITTDQFDYAPGDFALFTVTGVSIGGSVEFQVLHVSDPGADGVYGTSDDTLDAGPDQVSGTADDGYGTTGAGHDPFVVIDGGAGDLDGVANGTIETDWYVNPDDSLDETFLLTATDTSTGEVATTSFTDTIPTGNRVGDHNVWEIPNVQYVPGLVTGYHEGDSASFLVEVTFPEADQALIDLGDDGISGTPDDGTLTLDFNITLDLVADSGAAGYAFIDLGNFDDTVTPPIPNSDVPNTYSYANSENLGSTGGTGNGSVTVLYEGSDTVDLLSVTYTGADFAPSTNTQTWNVEYSVTDTGTYYFLYGGVLAQPGDIAPAEGGGITTVEFGAGDAGNFQAVIDTQGTGLKTVPFKGSLIIIEPDITVTKEIDRDANGSFESLASADEYSFSLYLDDGDGTAEIGGEDIFVTSGLTDALGQVVFPNVDDGTYWITEAQADFTQGTYTFANGVIVDSGTPSGFTGDIAQVTVSEGPRSGQGSLQEASVIFQNELVPELDPIITVIKDGPASVFEGGALVTYTFTLQNDSDGGAGDFDDDPLTITSITDDQFGDLLTEAEADNGGVPIVLQENESFTFDIERTVTGNFGETFTNVVTATGVDDEGVTDDSSDDHILNFDAGGGVAPIIDIVKDGEASINEGGDTATYTFSITNNSVSTDPVTIDALTDDQFGDLLSEAEADNGGNPITLASGASFTFDIDRDLTLDGGETHTNTVTVTATDDEGTSDTSSDDHVVTGADVAPVIDIVKDGEASINEGGDTATYTFSITNNSVSTDPVTIDALTDDQFGDLLSEAEADNGGNPITLASGASFTFDIDRDLTLDGGETHTNTVTVTATDDEGTSDTSSDDHVVTGADVAPVIDIVKDGEASINEGGDTATYTFSITNNSVSTDPVTIDALTDDQFGDLLSEAEADNGGNPITLASGASFTFDIDRDLTLDGGETHTNTVTVTATDDEGTSDTSSDDHVVTGADVAPVIDIVKDGEASINEGGDTATYTFSITNNSVSTDPVTIDALTDDQFGDLLSEAEADNGGNPITLASGASFTFDIDRDLTLDGGETHTNTVTVTATDDEGTSDTSSDDHVVTGADVAPVIDIVKDGEASINEGGDTATYTFSITNNSVSTDPVTIDALTDDQFGDLLSEAEADNGGNPITLASGASFTFDIDRDLTLDGGETHTNTVTVTATDDEGTSDTSSDDHVVTGADVAPVIDIVKDGEASINEGGDTATYTFSITNNSVSTDPVTIDALTDDQFGDLLSEAEADNGGNPITLASGASFTFDIDRDLTLDGGETHTNTVTVTATDDEGTSDTSSDDHVVTGADVAPVIDIVKDGEASINEGGDTATYTFSITNNSVSTDPVTIDALTDDQFGDLLSEAEADNGGNPITLASGASFTFDIDRDLTLDGGETHTNTVTVTATDDEGTSDTSSDDHVVTGADVAPVIDIVKDGEASINEGGDTATYTFSITNNSVSTDPVTIDALTDDQFGDLLSEAEADNGGNPITLASGASFTFDIDRDLTLDGGETHTNTVTVTATDDEGTSDTSSDDHVVTGADVAPVIDIVKDGEASINEGGDTATYTFSITNNSVSTDPVTIDALTDDQFGDLLSEAEADNGGNPITLASGASFTFDIDRDLTLDGGETHTNTVTVTATDDEGTSDTSSDDHVVTGADVAPVIDIVKDGEASINEGGDTATYTFSITNNSVSTDPVTIDALTDDQFGDLLSEAEADNGGNPITLASGASFTFDIDRDLTLDGGETHTNTVTVTATDDEGTSDTSSDDHVVTGADVAPVIDIVKDGEASINEGGDTATYTFSITNNSVSTDPVTIDALTDDQFGDLLSEAEADNGGNPITLASGASFTFDIDRDLTLDGGETHTNTVTVTATDDEGTSDTSSDDHVVTGADVAPVIDIVKDGEASINEGGDTATYTFSITNNSVSTDPVTIDALTDDQFGDLLSEAEADNGGNPITLASGASFTFDIDRDLTLDGGETHTNTVTVTATDDEGTSDTSSDDHVVTGADVAPVIDIVKDGEASINEGGDTATYTFSITNNSVSTDPVTIDALTDDQFGDLLSEAEADNGGNPITLASGASFTFDIDRDLTLDGGETHTNTVTVTATDDEGTSDTSSDDHVVTGADVAPVIDIVKDGEASINEGGDTATYTFSITNNSVSTDPVTIDALTDDQFGDLLSEAEADNGGNPITLASGASFTFDIDRDLTLDGGETHTNTVTVTATDDEGTSDTSSDDHVVTGADVAPVIDIVKDGEASINEGGDTATYTFSITNNSVSTDPVTIDALTDDQFGDLLSEAEADNGGNPITLASGASFTFDIDRDLTLDGGETHTNTVTVTATDDEGTSDTSSDDHVVTGADVAPVIDIVKDGEASINEGGDTATYTFSITNNSVSTDPVTIDALTDDQFGDLLSEAEADNGGNPITLASGASFTFDIDRDLTLDGGETHTNTVTVTATDDEGTSDTSSDDHVVTGADVAPVIDIVKDGEASINEGGDTATYTFSITNNSVSTDPVTIDALTDDQFGDLLSEAEADNGGNPITLASGASFTFDIDRDLTLDGGETHTNTVTVTATDDEGTSDTSSDDHVVTGADVAPVIDIVKDGEASINEGGDTATYTFSITNNSVSTDPVTIDALTDDQFGDLLSEAEADNGGNPITLASGASFTFDIDRDLTLDGGETHTNTVTVTATDDEGTSDTSSDDHVVTGADVAPVIDIVKDGEASINEGGDTATYTFSITNNSVSTDPVTIDALTDDQFGDLLSEAEADNGGNPITLASGASFTFDIDRDLTLDGGETHTNTVTVTATDDEGTSDTSSDDHVVTGADVAPVIDIVKDGEASINEGGDTATYTFSITNNSVSTDPVTITSLTDDKFGDLLAEAESDNGGQIVLASGASMTFDIDRELTLDGDETHTNTVTVTAVDDEGTSDTSSDDHTVTGDDVAPVIDLVKTVDANGDGIFSEFESIVERPEGYDVTYRYTLENQSPASTDEALELISFIDDNTTPDDTLDDIDLLANFVPNASYGDYYIGGDTNGDYKLDFDETWEFQAEKFVLNPWEDGVNTAEVTAQDNEETEATDVDDAEFALVQQNQRSISVDVPRKDNVGYVDDNGDGSPDDGVVKTTFLVTDESDDGRGANANQYDVQLTDLAASLSLKDGNTIIEVIDADRFWYDENQDGVFANDEELFDLDALEAGFQVDIELNEPVDTGLFQAEFDYTDNVADLNGTVTAEVGFFDEDRPFTLVSDTETIDTFLIG